MSRGRLSYWLTLKLWPLGRLEKKLASLPGLSRAVGPMLWNERNLDATYVPIGEAVDVEPGSVVPYQLITELVSRASHRFILSGCLCRTAANCEDFPPGVGCVFLGDAAADISPERGRPARVEETLEHVSRARELGLMPCIVHSTFDARLFDIDYRRMLAICFCCNCCCTFRTGMVGGPGAYRDRIVRLPGLTMRAVGDCSGCEKCARACFLGAISVTRDGPSFADFCKGCGRCAAACPRRNIRVAFEPGVDTRQVLFDRISSRTDIE